MIVPPRQPVPGRSRLPARLRPLRPPFGVDHEVGLDKSDGNPGQLHDRPTEGVPWATPSPRSTGSGAWRRRSWKVCAPLRAFSYQDLPPSVGGCRVPRSGRARATSSTLADPPTRPIMRLAETNRTDDAAKFMIDAAGRGRAGRGLARHGLARRGRARRGRARRPWRGDMAGSGGWGRCPGCVGCPVSGWSGTPGWRNRGRGRGVIPGERPQQHPRSTRTRVQAPGMIPGRRSLWMSPAPPSRTPHATPGRAAGSVSRTPDPPNLS